MTVYRPPDRKTYRYDFKLNGHRHLGSTGQVRKSDAQLFENKLKLRLRQRAGGVEPSSVDDTPSFQDWAEVYFAAAEKAMTRPRRVEDLLRVVLRFWGRRPDKSSKVQVVDGEPYHDLRLGHVTTDPYWIVKFETWLDKHRWANQTKNQYRSVMSQMFALAMEPAYRARTGIIFNPFRGIRRDRGRRRITTVTVDELRRWLSFSSYHVRLAMAIGALAPTLRLANILALEWGKHVNATMTTITVHEHKTAHETGLPLVVPISEQLRRILADAKRRNGKKFVVAYRGKKIRQIRGGVQRAAARAGLHYGRQDGVTFHTIRHAMATLFARLAQLDGGPALSESERMVLMGHSQLATTQIYTHIAGVEGADALKRLSAAVPVDDLVMHPQRRATKIGLLPPANQ